MLEMLDGPALLEGAAEWLARTPGILGAHVQNQSREMLDRRPRANAWSQTEILAHLADFEVICFQARVETILAGLPVLPMKPDKRAVDIPYAAMNPFACLDRFSGDREQSLKRIRQLSPDQLTCRAVHAELGEITLGNLLAEWVIHDLSHIRQLIVAAAQSFLPATGPWRSAYQPLEFWPAV
jgi:hypothetical protein